MVKQTLPLKPMDDASDDFETMYEANQPLIYRFMFWRTKDEMLAQDLTSNVFEKAWRTRQNFTGGSYKAWLYRIARTTLIDHWRKPRELFDEDFISSAVSHEAALDVALDKKMELTQLSKALVRLPKEMRTVVELRFIEGLSAKEVSVRLSLSEANVRVIQYRALRKLRSYLQ